MMFIGYIYKITNLVNNKSYIGKTNNLSRRLKEHFRGHGSTCILNAAILKYGSDSFSCEVITCIEEEDLDIFNVVLNALEIYYIKKYNTFHYGYNATIGGEGTSNYHHSESTKHKISAALKGILRTEEFKQRCRIARKGIPHTEETKALMRYIISLRTPEYKKLIYSKVGDKLRGRKRDPKLMALCGMKKRKSVLLYSLTGEFIAEYSSAGEAESILGIKRTSISNCVHGRSKTAGGFIWRKGGLPWE